MEDLKNKIAAFLYKVGLSADFITFVGLIFAFLAGLLIYEDRFFYAAVLVLTSGFLDLMDGAVARVSKKADKFGGVLDSSLDRYGDGFIFSGVLLYCLSYSKPIYALLTLSVLLGSFSISYVRARSECVIEKCKVGFWGRGERLVYLALGLFFHNLGLVLWVLGVATHFTVFQRLFYTRQALADKGLSLKTAVRNNAAYFVKCGVFFLLVLLFKIKTVRS